MVADLTLPCPPICFMHNNRYNKNIRQTESLTETDKHINTKPNVNQSIPCHITLQNRQTKNESINRIERERQMTGLIGRSMDGVRRKEG